MSERFGTIGGSTDRLARIGTAIEQMCRDDYLGEPKVELRIPLLFGDVFVEYVVMVKRVSKPA